MLKLTIRTGKVTHSAAASVVGVSTCSLHLRDGWGSSESRVPLGCPLDCQKDRASARRQTCRGKTERNTCRATYVGHGKPANIHLDNSLNSCPCLDALVLQSRPPSEFDRMCSKKCETCSTPLLETPLSSGIQSKSNHNPNQGSQQACLRIEESLVKGHVCSKSCDRDVLQVRKRHTRNMGGTRLHKIESLFDSI